jgi:hypothetical protein
MGQPSNQIDVYIESGKKRTFAGAIEWPGWCRRGRDEESALQALFDYGARYDHILQAAQIGFSAPTSTAALVVVERLEGSATTDFGAPDAAPAVDARAVNGVDLQRFQDLLQTLSMGLKIDKRAVLKAF